MSRSSRVWLWELTWQEVASYLERKDIVLIPVGSTEQHGPHLPLGVDALVAQRLAEDAARRADVLVAPPIWFGWAPQHMGFAGTVTLRAETLTALIEDVCLSLIHHGFRRIVIVNGHRIANLPPLQVAVARVRHKTGVYVGVADPVFLGHEVHKQLLMDADAGGVSHAEGLETAHMRHIAPDLVREDQVRRAIAGQGQHLPWHIVDPFRAGDRVWTATTANELRATAPTGAMGNPPWGTAERGRHLHEMLVERLVAFLQELESYPIASVRTEEYPV